MANPSKKTPAIPTPAKNKGGAPKGSCNGFRHGLHSANLPKKCRYIQWRLDALRRLLEQAILANKAEVGISDAAAIITIMRWEKAAQLHERRYRLDPEKYPDSPDKAAQASEKRDKALAALGLDVKPSPWAAITVEANNDD